MRSSCHKRDTRQPTDNAGIVPSDIVLEFGGKTTNNTEELVKEIQKRKAEEKVETLILRNPKRWIVEAILERTTLTKAKEHLCLV